MKFPAGTDGGTIKNPQDEDFIRDMMAFCGAIEITTTTGHGFILTDNGRLLSAYFRDGDGVFKGKDALAHMTLDTGDAENQQTFRLHTYNADDLARALQVSRAEGLLLSEISPEPVTDHVAEPAEEPVAEPVQESPEEHDGVTLEVSDPHRLDEATLHKLLSQPGVLAVSAFFEGFPVQSLGDADFEHVAASAEDFARAGTKIAQEMDIGHLEQLILETASNKFIIAPCGDLYICIFTRSDAQLGLIRVLLRSIQQEISG